MGLNCLWVTIQNIHSFFALLTIFLPWSHSGLNRKGALGLRYLPGGDRNSPFSAFFIFSIYQSMVLLLLYMQVGADHHSSVSFFVLIVMKVMLCHKTWKADWKKEKYLQLYIVKAWKRCRKSCLHKVILSDVLQQRQITYYSEKVSIVSKTRCPTGFFGEKLSKWKHG